VATEVIVWSLADGRRLLTLSGDSRCVAFSPDGSRLLVGGKNGRVCDSADGRTVFSFVGHPRPVDQVAVSRDGKRIVSVNRPPAKGADESHVRVWDAATGRLVCAFEIRPSLRPVIALDAEGETILGVDSRDRDVKVWSADTGRLLRLLP
jgi:WD40 repeat protein